VYGSCRFGFQPLDLSNNDKLNLVKVDGRGKIVVVDIADAAVPDIVNYILVDCVSGVCRQTQGYILNFDIINAFVGTKGGDSTIAGACEEGNIGKFLSGSSGVCVNAVTGQVTTALLSPSGEYLISGAVAGTPFEDGKYSVALKVAAKYIIKDKFNSEGKN